MSKGESAIKKRKIMNLLCSIQYRRIFHKTNFMEKIIKKFMKAENLTYIGYVYDLS